MHKMLCIAELLSYYFVVFLYYMTASILEYLKVNWWSGQILYSLTHHNLGRLVYQVK